MNIAKDLGLPAMDATTAITSESAVPGAPKQGEPSKVPVEKAPFQIPVGRDTRFCQHGGALNQSKVEVMERTTVEESCGSLK